MTAFLRLCNSTDSFASLWTQTSAGFSRILHQVLWFWLPLYPVGVSLRDLCEEDLRIKKRGLEVKVPCQKDGQTGNFHVKTNATSYLWQSILDLPSWVFTGHGVMQLLWAMSKFITKKCEIPPWLHNRQQQQKKKQMEEWRWNEGGEAWLGSQRDSQGKTWQEQEDSWGWKVKELERVLLMVWKLMLILISDIIFIFFLCFLESTSRAHLLVSGVFRVVTISSLPLPSHCLVKIVTMSLKCELKKCQLWIWRISKLVVSCYPQLTLNT